MEPNGSWDINPNNCEVDFEWEVWFSFDDLDAIGEECKNTILDWRNQGMQRQIQNGKRWNC